MAGSPTHSKRVATASVTKPRSAFSSHPSSPSAFLCDSAGHDDRRLDLGGDFRNGTNGNPSLSAPSAYRGPQRKAALHRRSVRGQPPDLAQTVPRWPGATACSPMRDRAARRRGHRRRPCAPIPKPVGGECCPTTNASRSPSLPVLRVVRTVERVRSVLFETLVGDQRPHGRARGPEGRPEGSAPPARTAVPPPEKSCNSSRIPSLPKVPTGKRRSAVERGQRQSRT